MNDIVFIRSGFFYKTDGLFRLKAVFRMRDAAGVLHQIVFLHIGADLRIDQTEDGIRPS